MQNSMHISLNEQTEKIFYIIAGCNGAGKTTAFKGQLAHDLKMPVFLNADEETKRICPDIIHETDQRIINIMNRKGGRCVIERLKEQLEREESFCIETTLAARNYLQWIHRAHERGFKVALFYYWLSSPEYAVKRVAQRVQAGGHNVPEEDIRRRYIRGLQYLSTLYIPAVDYWKIIRNDIFPVEVARGAVNISDPHSFQTICDYAKHLHKKS